MKLLLVPLTLSAAMLASPVAAAQVYSDFHETCREQSRENRITGAVIGGVLGGLLGNEVAGRGVQVEGRTIGALVGSVAGAEIGRDSVDCDIDYYEPTYKKYRNTAGYDPYDEPSYSPTSGPDYGDEYPSGGEYDLYGGDDGGYASDPDQTAAVECETVTRVTRLPDGRELYEPARACRRAYYGDWALE